MIADISFLGEGCAISQASASLMTEALKGKTEKEAMILFKAFHVLLTEDEKGNDEKIIAVPDEYIDPRMKNIDNYSDLSNWTLSKIDHFFTHYKDNEENKWVKVKGFKNKNDALDVLKKSVERFTNYQI